jgi:hypothetical protein
MLGLGPVEFIRPVLRVERGEWERLEPGMDVALPDGRELGAWEVDIEASRADIALCYPYGRPELEALVEESGGELRMDSIGVSQGGRAIQRVSNSPGTAGDDRPGLYVIARQHSGETPGSWVLDGMLRQFAAEPDDAPLVWAVPLSNIDGVETGAYGKDNFPWDLNRAWGRQPMRHEVMAVQRDMARWRERCRASFGLDLHAPGGCETDGIYAHMPDRIQFPDRYRRALPWAEAMAEALGDEFTPEPFPQVHHWASRWQRSTFSRYCFQHVGVAAVCVETPYSMAKETVFTCAAYREAGARIARALTAC